MVFFNYSTMQMAAKIVYYGPGLCGKTTNLHHIYTKTSPQSRGEMVSLETETDRTLFFDLLPIDVGVIGGFKTRLQLYTIPGQVFYNTTRKLVLKGVDGLVFVADSQLPMLDANLDSFKNLRENLSEIGVSLEDIPLVLQLNKRDLPNVATVDTLLDALDPQRKYEHVEAIAASGSGVFETLKLISKLTLRTLRQRMTGEEALKPTARKPAETAQFRVKDDASRPPARAPAAPAVATPAPPTTAKFGAPSAAATSTAPMSAHTQTTQAVEDEVEQISASETPSQVITQPTTPPAAEPEIDFSQTDKAAKAAPKVKTVKVRSSIDVMAELEALRKKATQGSAKTDKKKAAAAAAGPATGRELHKALSLQVGGDVLSRARSMRVTVSFEGAGRDLIQEQTGEVDLDEAADVRSVSLNLRIDQS